MDTTLRYLPRKNSDMNIYSNWKIWQNNFPVTLVFIAAISVPDSIDIIPIPIIPMKQPGKMVHLYKDQYSEHSAFLRCFRSHVI